MRVSLILFVFQWSLAIRIALRLSPGRLEEEPTRKAFIVGFRYANGNSSAPEGGAQNITCSWGELPGTIRDAENVVKRLLLENWSPSDIYFYTDEAARPMGLPERVRHSQLATREAFGDALKRASREVGNNGELFVFFAGHGDVTTDKNGDELDGLDESLVMPDRSLFVDDMFYDDILLPLSVTVSATIIVDACHSEGFSDLPYNYDSSLRTWCWDTLAPKALPTARIAYLAAAQNHQAAFDNGTSGDMTHALLHVFNKALPVYQGMLHVSARLLHTQVPNVAAYPSFRDTSRFSPWSLPAALESFDLDERPIADRFYPRVCAHGLRHLYDRARQLFAHDFCLDSAARDWVTGECADRACVDMPCQNLGCRSFEDVAATTKAIANTAVGTIGRARDTIGFLNVQDAFDLLESAEDAYENVTEAAADALGLLKSAEDAYANVAEIADANVPVSAAHSDAMLSSRSTVEAADQAHKVLLEVRFLFNRSRQIAHAAAREAQGLPERGTTASSFGSNISSDDGFG